MTPQRDRSALHRQRGGVLVEFGVSALFALTLIFGLIDFGLCLFSYDAVVDAAQVGSRYAMVRGSSCTATGCPATSTSVQTYVRTRSAGINVNSLTVNTTWSAGSGCTALPLKGAGCVVTVVATYPFAFFSPLMPRLSWNMSSTSMMVISQ